MAKRFEIPGKGLGNVPFRADIYDAQYGGSSPSVLDGSGQHIVVDRGQRGDDDTNPIFPSEARIYVRDDADLSPLFKREDRDVRIEIIRTDTGNLTFEGFMLTDFFEDAPYLPGDPKVQIRAADGVSTLKQRGFDFFYGDGYRYIPYTTGIIELLKDLYPYPKNLDVEFGFEWYPDNPDLDSGDNPLRHMGIKPDNYKEDRGEGNSAWWNAFAVLKDMLKDFDLTLKQVQPEGEEAHWHIRHRSALDEDSDPAGLKVWRYNHDASLKSGYPKVRTVERDLTGEQFFVDHNRGFDRRWQSFSLKHNHTPVQGLVGEGGFENVPLGPVSDPWTELSFSSDITAEVVEYSDDNVTPDQTQDNQHLFRVKYDPENFNGDFFFPYLIEQDLGSLSGFVGEANGKLTITGGVFSRVNKDSPKGWAEDRLARLVVNGDKEWFLNYRRTNVRQSVNKGTGTVPVAPIDGPIPKGAVVPFVRKDSYHNPNDNSVSESWISYAKSTIKLTERADKGDEILVGEISADVKGKWKVAYPVFDTTKKNGVMIRQHRSRDAGWGTQDIVFPLEDVNGNIVQGDVTLQLGVRINDEDSPNDAPRVNYVAHCYDDVDVEITVRGEPLKETITVASVSEFGERIGYEVRTSDTPTPGNLARLRGEKSGSYLPENFGIGPIAQRSNSLALGKLMGREKMRYMREDPERLTLTFPIENGAPYIDAHELLVFDGRYWTISNIKHVVQDGEIEVEVLEYTDHGTSGIIYSVTVQEEGEETSGGGGGGVVGSVSGFGGNPPPTEVLDALHTEDETFLYVASGTGENPDYLSVRAKDEDDMASDSDAHLPTQKSVKAYVDSSTAGTEKNARAIVQNRAQIDALDAVTVRRSRSVTAKGQENRVEVDASETIDGTLTKDLVLAFDAPQDLHSGADFEVATLAAGSPNTPTDGQIALGAQAGETYEAVRADRKVTITGTTNQVGVNGRSGMLTQDVNVTLNAPQDLHTAADFEVGTLAAGAPSNTPGDINAAGTIFSETAVRIQSPSKTPELLNVAGGGFFEDEINADEGIVADSYNVSTLGGSGYVLRRLQDDSTQLYSDEIVANTFRVAEFLVNQITFSASEAISAGFVARAPITDNGGGEFVVNADTNPTVAADDLVRAKRFTDGSHDSKARVISVSRNGSDSTVTLQLVDDSNNDVSPSASNDAPQDGFQYARIGNLSDPNRQNLIYLTASDASNPRIDFFEGVSEFSEFGVDALTTRVGNLSGLSSAYSNKMGVFSEVGRFTSDVIIGDLEAGTNSSVSGQYLKYDGTDIQIVTASGDVETLITTNASDISQNESDIADNKADLLLLAHRITQESESRAGLEFNVGQNSASIEANATVIGDDGLFSQSTLSLHARDTETRFEASVQYTENNNDVGGRASISLLAGPGGSDAILAGENILLDGDTEVQGGFTVSDTNIETGYRVTLRQPTEPGDGDVTGRNLKDGDIWIDTDDGDTVHTYDGQSGAFQRTHSESVVIRQDSEPSSRPSGNDLQAGDIWIDTDGGDTVYTYDGSDFSAADNGNITIRQNSEPSTRPGGETLVKGDIWIDTDADDTVYTYDGSGWVETTSQNVVIRQASKPSSRPSGNSLEKGDVWIDTDNGDTVYTYDGSSFTPADNGNVTVRQASTPSQRSSGAPLIKGDVWIDTDAGDTVYTYDGSSFQRVQSDNVVIRSDSTPTERPSGNNLQEGDVWIETDEGNAVHTYNGASFERTKGEGNVTIRQASAPSQRPSGEDLEEGDTWIDTDDGNAAYTYDGSQWVKTEADLRAQADQNSADVELVARRLTQSTEAQAGIEANVNEHAATLTASVQFENRTSGNTSRAAVELFAGPDGSAATIIGESIQLDGDTIIDGTLSIDKGGVGGWTITNSTIENTSLGSNGDGEMTMGQFNASPYRYGIQVGRFGSSPRGQFRLYIGEDDAPNFEMLRDFRNKIQMLTTAGPNNDQMEFIVLAQGDPILKTSDTATFGPEDGYAATIASLYIQDGALIEGDALVQGSVIADKVSTDDLAAINATLGSVTINEGVQIGDLGSILMGAGADRFLVGDFDISGSGSDNGYASDSTVEAKVTDTYLPNEDSASWNDTDSGPSGGFSGWQVTVEVPYQRSVSTSSNIRAPSPGTYGKHEITLEVLDGNGNVVQTVTKEESILNTYDGTGITTVSFTADPGVTADSLKVYSTYKARLAEDEELYTEIALSNDGGAPIDYVNSRDFVGGEGAIWRESDNRVFKIDATSLYQNDSSPRYNDNRVEMRGGTLRVWDENGRETLRIHPQGFIDFREQDGTYGYASSPNGGDFPEPDPGWVRLGAEENDNKMARKSSDGSSNDF